MAIVLEIHVHVAGMEGVGLYIVITMATMGLKDVNDHYSAVMYSRQV